MEGFMRLLSQREDKEKKVLEIGLVSTIVDSYRTVINPRGCVSPLESVPVDYNHNRISTGAKMFDKGFKEMDVQTENGEEKVEVRVVEVHVYKDSRMWTRENKDKKPEDVANLYDAVVSGRVAWGSVDFEPIPEHTERVYNANGDLIREEYKKWRLNFFSLLDTKPGQDTSYFFSVRMKETDTSDNILRINLNSMYTELKDAITARLQEMEIENPEVAEVTQTYTDETTGRVSCVVGEKRYSGDYKISEEEVDGEKVSRVTIETLEEETSDEEVEEEETDVETDDTDEILDGEPVEESKRMRVKELVKNKEGKFAMVVKRVEESTEEGTQVVYTLQDIDSGEEFTASGDQVGYDWDGETEKEWEYAEASEVVVMLLKIVKGQKPKTEDDSEEGDEPDDEEEGVRSGEGEEGEGDQGGEDLKAGEETARLKKELEDKDAEIRSLKEKFTRLNNSPEDGEDTDSGAATDGESEGEDAEEGEENLEETRMELLANNER